MKLSILRDKISKNPGVLKGLTDETAIAVIRDLVEELDAKYEKDAWLWAKEQVWTQDEASGQSLRFPADRDYLRDLFEILQKEQLVAIPKSRRVFVTWALATYLTHRARYRKHQALFVQSETEDKAAYVVEKRCGFIEENLPAALRRAFKGIKTIRGATGQMTYEKTRSYIRGVAQGRDALRSYTPSVLVLDESEFMGEGRESLVAALPFAEKQSQVVIISTSNGAQGPLADIARSVGFVSYRK